MISTGVTNGFWRRPDLQSADEIGNGLRAAHDRLAAAESVAVIGGGAAAVSSAANVARTWPGKRVGLYFPGERALVHHHTRVWERVRRRLIEFGVELHPGHRAVVPDGFECDDITTAPVEFSTGQPTVSADAVLWATGRVRPNTDWLPAELLDEHGFVRVTPELRVPDHRGVFAIGDVAATDPLRTSARNRADGLLARNILAEFAGPSAALLPPREPAVGFGPRDPARRTGGLRAERKGIPFPGLVVRTGLDVVDRAARHLPRCAGEPAAVLISRRAVSRRRCGPAGRDIGWPRGDYRACRC